MTKPPKSTDHPPATTAAVRVTAAKCVRCGTPVQPRFRPFCSQRCADVDLGQWASGGYRIPTAEPTVGQDEDEG
ncbi:MAG: DNA gyrase inhibitor YacG [Rhodospirillaceae bacterium]|nr:MAG: DNA gyrase inhibitor YacG [Rhodospirillaceae bacterium]